MLGPDLGTQRPQKIPVLGRAPFLLIVRYYEKQLLNPQKVFV